MLQSSNGDHHTSFLAVLLLSLSILSLLTSAPFDILMHVWPSIMWRLKIPSYLLLVLAKGLSQVAVLGCSHFKAQQLSQWLMQLLACICWYRTAHYMIACIPHSKREGEIPRQKPCAVLCLIFESDILSPPPDDHLWNRACGNSTKMWIPGGRVIWGHSWKLATIPIQKGYSHSYKCMAASKCCPNFSFCQVAYTTWNK